MKGRAAFMPFAPRACVVVVLGALLLFVAWAGEARADAGRAVVVVVEGPDADAVAAAVAAHVEAPHTVGDARSFRAALAKRGAAQLAPAVGNRGRAAQLVARSR